MPLRNVLLNQDNKPEVQLCHTDQEQLNIDNYNRIYVMLDNVGLYILHADTWNTDSVKGISSSYRWLATWNSVTWTSVKGISNWLSIEDALNDALKAGYKVAQLNYDAFKDIIRQME